MEKGMLSSTINHLQKTMQPKSYQIGQVIPVFPSTKLLGNTRHQNLIQELLPLSQLDENRFKLLYRSAINQYVEFVQLIPEEVDTPLGGLLNVGLARAVLSLRQFCQDAQSKSESTDPLTLYAIFTASLFYDVAKAVSQQRVIVCNDVGFYHKEWFPYYGSLLEQSTEYYKMYPYNNTVYQALNHESAAILARQLIPREGFIWLSSDLDLFIDWLESIRGEHRQEGRRVSRALALVRKEDLQMLVKGLQQVNLELPSVKDLNSLDQFYLWIQEGITNGEISINTKDAHVQYLEDGTLYINHELFKRFNETNKIPGDSQGLVREFNEQFGVAQHVIHESRVNSTFLSQSWEPKITQGTLAFASQFIMDYTGIPVSPLQEKIKSGTKTIIKESRFKPNLQVQSDAIKQSLNVEQRPQSSSPNFKMR